MMYSLRWLAFGIVSLYIAATAQSVLAGESQGESEGYYLTDLSELMAEQNFELVTRGEEASSENGNPSHGKVSSSGDDNPVTVVRIMATWCPYSQWDMYYLAEWMKTYSNNSRVHVVLLTYSQDNGDRENRDRVQAFYDNKLKKWFGEEYIDQVSVYYSDKESASEGLRAATFIDEGYGFPYSMIFDHLDNRLVESGNFTQGNPQAREPYRNQHEIIESLLKED